MIIIILIIIINDNNNDSNNKLQYLNIIVNCVLFEIRSVAQGKKMGF